MRTLRIRRQFPATGGSGMTMWPKPSASERAATRAIRTAETALLLLVALALSHVMSAVAAARVVIPEGRHMLVDAKVGPGEWTDARHNAESGSFTPSRIRDARAL